MITKFMLFYHKQRLATLRIVSPLFGMAAALVMSAASLEAGTVVDGYEWESLYHGNEIPIVGDANWTTFKGNATSPPTHVGTALVINTNGVLTQQAYYTSTLWAPLTTGQAAVEFRMNLDAVASGSANQNTMAFQIGTSTGGMVFYLGAGGLYLYPGSGEPVVSDFNAFDVHTYRLTLNLDAKTFSLDIDGDRKLTDKSLISTIAGNVLRIGDSSSSVSGITRYEYVAWNNASGPVPVPEPASAFLFSIAGGAIALLKYSRR